MKGVKTPLRIKLLISFISLIFFLGLLEAGLRVTGFFVQQSRRPDLRDLTNSEGTEAVRILCVGDSFTWGGRGNRDQSYPAHLSRILNGDSEAAKFAVINYGACESNSSDVLGHLPNWLNEFNPHVAILLVGSANRFNPWNNVAFIQDNFGQRFISLIRDLRVVKMARIMSLNVRARTAAQSGEGPSIYKERYPDSRFLYHIQYLEPFEKIKEEHHVDTRLRDLWHHFNTDREDEAIDEGLAQLSADDPPNEDVICAVSFFMLRRGRSNEAEKLLTEALTRSPGSEKLLNALGYTYREIAKIHLDQMQFEKVIHYSLKAIEIDPTEYYNFYRMTKAYDLQSHYDAAMIGAALDRIASGDPTLRDQKWFAAYREIYRDKRAWEKNVNMWLKNDLDEIVKLCRVKGVRLILQNYPIDYPMANKQLSATALRYQLPFVDNLSKFRSLAPRNKYIMDDDHCTDVGHGVMADNVYRILTRELDLKPVKAAVNE